MADDTNEAKDDELRVIPDEGAGEADEVIRLEPESPKFRKKDAVLSEGKAMPQMMGDAKVDSVAESESPEDGWASGETEEEARVIPIGWFVLLGVGIFSLLVWVGLQQMTSPEPVVEEGVEEALEVPEVTEVVVSPEKENLTKEERELEEQEAEESYGKLEEVVRGFLEAKSIDERARFIRHPERVRKLMEDYYSRTEFVSFGYRSIDEFIITPLKVRSFIALDVTLEDGESKPLLVEDAEGEYLIDWESFVSYQPYAISELLEVEPTEPFDLRAYVAPDNYYTYEFDDEGKYFSFRLNFRGEETALYGYLEKGTLLEESFRKIFTVNGRLSGLPRPLILRVRFLENGRAERSVVIEELMSTTWAYVENPDLETQ